MVSEIGGTLYTENLELRKKELLDKFKLREEMIKMQLDHEFDSEVDVLSSKVQAEYEKKLAEFRKKADEDYNVRNYKYFLGYLDFDIGDMTISILI